MRRPRGKRGAGRARSDACVYFGVPGEMHRSFLDADSQGRFFAIEIRGRYPFNKLAEL